MSPVDQRVLGPDGRHEPAEVAKAETVGRRSGAVSTPPQLGAVVFDFGGVLTVPVRESFGAWLLEDRIEPDSFSRVVKRWMSSSVPDRSPVHRLETGELPLADFERLLAVELTTVDGTPVEAAGLVSRMFAAMHVDREMLTLAQDLRNAGVRVALLSNSWGIRYPRRMIDDLFNPVVISGEVGMRKPHAPIFELTLERLGVAAERVVFLDDAEANVMGARAVGLQAWRHVDPGSTRSALAAVVPDLNRISVRGVSA